jgi:type IV secretion system protein VirB5
MRNLISRIMMSLALALALTPLAHAQFAVIDVAAVAQLLSEVNTLEQQLATARNELSQAQTAYQSITGQRGMQQLLSGVPRNYLPSDWTGVEALLRGGGGFPLLTGELQTSLRSAAVLSPQQLAALPPSLSQQLQTSRQNVALLQSLSHTALANASGRFGELQQLISAIGTTSDQKAILELQARIGAESSMLQAEHTKLQTLQQALQGEEWSAAQRSRELAIAGHGQFASRFQPRP